MMIASHSSTAAFPVGAGLQTGTEKTRSFSTVLLWVSNQIFFHRSAGEFSCSLSLKSTFPFVCFGISVLLLIYSLCIKNYLFSSLFLTSSVVKLISPPVSDNRGYEYGLPHFIIEVTGGQQKIDALIRLLEPMGVKKLARSGILALYREPE